MKKKKNCIAIIMLLCLGFLSGCKVKTEGDTIQAFTNRINELYGYEAFTVSGYIYDTHDKTISKFYSTDKREFLLKFAINENFLLKNMNIVFDSASQIEDEEKIFIKNCIYAFVNDKTTADNLMHETALFRENFAPSYNTLSKKIGDIEIMIDITEIGTVITVVKSNL